VIDYRFVVSDEDGELRRFATKVDACEFMRGQDGMKLTVLPPSRRCMPVDPLTLVGECRF
jgi:hypothetical protein